MVYYPINSSSNKINDLFNIGKEQKETILNFLKPNPDMIFTDVSSNQYYKDSESVVVHDKEHIKRIDITNKLINNLNTRTFDFSKNRKNMDCANLQDCIEEYNKFIGQNKNELMDGITDASEKTIIENELFVSPVFFYIIGKKLEFGNCEIDDLDLDDVKKELDNQAGKFKNLLSQTLVKPIQKNRSSSSSSSSSPPDDDDDVLKPKNKAALSAIESKKKSPNSSSSSSSDPNKEILAAVIAILAAADSFDNAINTLKNNVDAALINGLITAQNALTASAEALRDGATYISDEAQAARINFVRESNVLFRNAIQELGRAQVALRAVSDNVGNAAGNAIESVQNATIEAIASVAQGLENATVALGAAATRVGNATRETLRHVRDRFRRVGGKKTLKSKKGLILK